MTAHAGRPSIFTRVRRIAATLAVVGYVSLQLPACGGDNGPGQPRPPSEPPPTPGGPRTLYVSPQGAATNDGSQASPIDLATALSATGPTTPGSTVWLRGGTYRGGFTSRLTGRADAPIVVRGVPGERAVLDGAGGSGAPPGVVLNVQGAYTTFRDFEVTYSNPARTDPGRPGEPNGIYANASDHLSIVNLIVHDLPGQGLGIWAESLETEVYGNIVFYNGTSSLDHGIYTQNATGTKRIEENILFDQASHGIHAYAAEAPLDFFHMVGNVAFNNGFLLGPAERNILVGGLRVARNLTLAENFTYYPLGTPRGSNNIGYSAGCADATITGNYFAGPNALTLINCLPELAGNVLVGSLVPPDLFAFRPDNQFSPGLPRGARVAVRPNRYERGRAHVIVYNWDLQGQVTVDLSASGLTSGQRFEVRDVQDLAGSPILTGTYTGAPIVLPMSGLRTATPVWSQAVPPRHTAPEFAVFVVLPR